LARPIDNPLVNRLLTNYVPAAVIVFLKARLSAESPKDIENWWHGSILADLNTTREAGVFCDFFGVQACTTTSLATLALRNGRCGSSGLHRLGRKMRIHRLYGEQPVETIVNGDFEADVRVNTARYTKVIESIIRRHPDQWLWIHRRWRTRPDKEPEIYESAWSN